jgi:hypothetical protein
MCYQSGFLNTKKMKESEYLEKYGFEIPFTEKELSLIGREMQFCKADNDEIIKQGIVTDLTFGESTVKRNGKKYLTVSFAVGDWWSREFPTEILSPPIYLEYTNDLVKQSVLIINDSPQAE